MTRPVVFASEAQPAATYPFDYLQGVLPEEVDRKLCEHEVDPPESHCVHDWRIEWGNVEKTEAE
jgi:hypothetical protein